MFFVRFIPTFPLLHRATFVFRDCIHPLLLNAIAIGSLYLGPADAVAKGEGLWRLSYTATTTSWQTLIKHQGPYDSCPGAQLVIGALLGQVYGLLSGNAAIRSTSQAFHALSFFWARRCGMFDTPPFSCADLPSLEAPHAEKEHSWRIWAAREIQQRSLLAHYMLNGLISAMTGDPTSVRHAANKSSLPCQEVVFEASTADEWLLQMQIQQADRPTFSSLFPLLFSPLEDPCALGYDMSAFSFKVLLEGLQSFITDCSEETAPVMGAPTRTEIRRALCRVYDSISESTILSHADRLETLLRWHTICLDAATRPTLLCERSNIDQNEWAIRKRLSSNLGLDQWAHGQEGRRALLHAVAIQDIVEQLPRGRAHAMTMPTCLFAAGMVYTVFALAGLVSVSLPGTVEWTDVLKTTSGNEASPPSTTTQYVAGGQVPDVMNMMTRNLLYEFNSVQKLFGCL